MRHYTESLDEFPEIDPTLSKDLYETIVSLLEGGKQSDAIHPKVHPYWFLKGCYFLLLGYFGLDGQRNLQKAPPGDYEGFKQFFYAYVCEMLGIGQ